MSQQPMQIFPPKAPMYVLQLYMLRLSIPSPIIVAQKTMTVCTAKITKLTERVPVNFPKPRCEGQQTCQFQTFHLAVSSWFQNPPRRQLNHHDITCLNFGTSLTFPLLVTHPQLHRIIKMHKLKTGCQSSGMSCSKLPCEMLVTFGESNVASSK